MHNGKTYGYYIDCKGLFSLMDRRGIHVIINKMFEGFFILWYSAHVGCIAFAYCLLKGKVNSLATDVEWI
jgi:hypothetical protein